MPTEAFSFGHTAFDAGVIVTNVRISKVGVIVGMAGRGVRVGGRRVLVGKRVARGEGEFVNVGGAIGLMGVTVSEGWVSIVGEEQAAKRMSKRQQGKIRRMIYFSPAFSIDIHKPKKGKYLSVHKGKASTGKNSEQKPG